MIEASTTTAAFIVRSWCFVCVSASVAGACGNGNGRLSLSLSLSLSLYFLKFSPLLSKT